MNDSKLLLLSIFINILKFDKKNLFIMFEKRFEF